jgi:heme/copper-type cytochrome/quinol oxidase subunit 2
MLATLLGILAQNSQEAPDEGIGLGLILLGVLIAVIVAVAIFTVFTRASKRRAEKGAPDDPHRPGHVGH